MASSGMTTVKVFFVLFNLAFMVGSAALIYLGIGVLTEIVQIDYEKFFQQDTFYTLAYGITALGVFVFVLSFIGCCGTIRQSRWLLTTFGSIMTIVVIMQIVLCVLLFLYQKEVENIAYQDSKELAKRLRDHYNYSNSSEPLTKWIDNVQKYLRCCGLNGTTDWPYGKVPYSCCEDNRTQIYQNQPLQEQFRVNTNIQYCLDNKQGHYSYQEGCLNKIINVTYKNVWYLGSTAISFALVQVMAILLSCCIAYSTKKSYQTI